MKSLPWMWLRKSMTLRLVNTMLKKSLKLSGLDLYGFTHATAIATRATSCNDSFSGRDCSYDPPNNKKKPPPGPPLTTVPAATVIVWPPLTVTVGTADVVVVVDFAGGCALVGKVTTRCGLELDADEVGLNGMVLAFCMDEPRPVIILVEFLAEKNKEVFS